MFDSSRTGQIELKNVNRDVVNWLDSIVEENNANVEKKECKSKYNSYVIYDYEPFCSEGFEINYIISSCEYSYLSFIKYLYEEKISTIDFLNKCYSL